MCKKHKIWCSFSCTVMKSNHFRNYKRSNKTWKPASTLEFKETTKPKTHLSLNLFLFEGSKKLHLKYFPTHHIEAWRGRNLCSFPDGVDCGICKNRTYFKLPELIVKKKHDEKVMELHCSLSNMICKKNSFEKKQNTMWFLNLDAEDNRYYMLHQIKPLEWNLRRAVDNISK